MKRFFSLAVIAVFCFSLTCGAMAPRNAQILHIDEVHHASTIKKFKKSTRMNQYEMMVGLTTELKRAYDEADSVDDMYELREVIETIIWEIMPYAKTSMPDVNKDLNRLNEKISRAIRINDPHASDRDGSRSRYNHGHEYTY